MRTASEIQCPSPLVGSRIKGVSYHRASRKWLAYINVSRVRHNLGLFETQAEAADARKDAERRLAPPLEDKEVSPSELLARVRTCYQQEGLRALSSDFLEKQPGALYKKLRNAGLSQSTLLAELQLTEQYSQWREENQTYGGKPRPRWTWDRVLSTAREIKDIKGYLPTMDWFRENGYHGLIGSVFHHGQTWEGLREILGCFATSHFVQSRNGMRWRSQPEACLSDFLHARGIKHKRGERYDESYSASQSLRKRGHYDVHLIASDGRWIDVEIWGEGLGAISSGRYEATRKKKEEWLAGNNPNFLGIEYRDCLSEGKLEAILSPYIGTITPFNFAKGYDPFIQTAHWSGAEELLETCRQIAEQQPDGFFPSESWLRKRGKYADREGQVYNSLALYVNERLGGFRNVRKLLGQAHASTNAWTPELLIDAWRDFYRRYGCLPTTPRGSPRFEGSEHASMRREASRLWEAARRHGVLEKCKAIGAKRAVKWTPGTTEAAWRSFVVRHGKAPTECMSISQRTSLPQETYAEATRIYGAARRLGLLDRLREQCRSAIVTHPA